MSRRGAALLIVGVVVGCGGGGKSGPGTEPTDKDAAEDVAAMLKEFGEQAKRPPAGLHELGENASASHPLGHGAVQSQQFVVYWRAPVTPGSSTTVLAYHKDVPTKGGIVVMQDGSVKQMTAEEFKAAPKAGK
jgi:hypothetical protein